MMNYGQSKGLVQIDEGNMYHGSDPFVLGKPLAIEYNPNVFEDHQTPIEQSEKTPTEIKNEPPKMQPQRQPRAQQEKAGFFITENQNQGGIDG